MSNHLLQKVNCPSCASPINLREQSTDGTYIHCDACGGEFILRGHICPYCGTYHESEAAFCRQCGAGLSRRCPKCNISNWIGDEYCIQCGSPLDILEIISHRYVVETSDRLYRQMDEGDQVKHAELAASEARMARMLAEERQAQADLRRRRLEQKKQEQKMITIAIAVAVVFVIIVVVTLIVGGF